MIKSELNMVRDFDVLARLCDDNFTVLCKHVNRNEDNIGDLVSAMEKLTKKCKHKASKLSLFMAVAAGIVYVVKNEIDKHDMKMKLIEQDKAQRFGSELESEGEAMDAAFI